MGESSEISRTDLLLNSLAGKPKLRYFYYMKRFLPLFFIAVLFIGCSSIENAQAWLKEMQAVQTAVVDHTGHEDTRINQMNGHVLQVVLVNSKYNEMKGEEKEKATKEIAQLAYDTLQTKAGIDQVQVVFHIHEKKMGVVEYNNSLDSHSFPVDELTEAGGPTPASTP